MTKKLEIYKCEICGNIVEILHTGAGELVCCNQPMNLMEENMIDAATEKHVPVINKTQEGIKVSVGSIDHPMEEKHYIEWIELQADDQKHKQFLKPGEKPEVIFKIEASNLKARSYCNLHGLWKS
jgi:superoxide reductase